MLNSIKPATLNCVFDNLNAHTFQDIVCSVVGEQFLGSIIYPTNVARVDNINSVINPAERIAPATAMWMPQWEQSKTLNAIRDLGISQPNAVIMPYFGERNSKELVKRLQDKFKHVILTPVDKNKNALNRLINSVISDINKPVGLVVPYNIPMSQANSLAAEGIITYGELPPALDVLSESGDDSKSFIELVGGFSTDKVIIEGSRFLDSDILDIFSDEDIENYLYRLTRRYGPAFLYIPKLAAEFVEMYDRLYGFRSAVFDKTDRDKYTLIHVMYDVDVPWAASLANAAANLLAGENRSVIPTASTVPWGNIGKFHGLSKPDATVMVTSAKNAKNAGKYNHDVLMVVDL